MSVGHARVGNDDLIYLTETHNTASGSQDSTRITRQDLKMRNIAESQTFSAIFFCRHGSTPTTIRGTNLRCENERIFCDMGNYN